MAFDSLSERLQSTLKKVSGQGQLTESNMEEMLTEIRLALLERTRTTISIRRTGCASR